LKVVILAGGLGTRLTEETITKPKPMVEIGGIPILVHIMNMYSRHGFHDFIVATGYKGEYIEQYFDKYDGMVDLLDTGKDTNTGGRIKRVAEYIGYEPFMLTYGDGVSDIDLNALLSFHYKHNKLATVTAVRPPARFGKLVVDGEMVSSFSEKTQADEGWINGGFFVLQPAIVNYITDDSTSWEYESLGQMAKAGQLAAYQHNGFWQCMDTMHDVRTLNELWKAGAPWA
jgi:glucose-1-phosphate cytidylyltransferase